MTLESYFARWRFEEKEMVRGFEANVPSILLEFLRFKADSAYRNWVLACAVDRRAAADGHK